MNTTLFNFSRLTQNPVKLYIARYRASLTVIINASSFKRYGIGRRTKQCSFALILAGRMVRLVED